MSPTLAGPEPLDVLVLGSGVAGLSAAVRLAAPFDLPPDLYAAWKHVAQFRFDRKLSQ